MITDNDSLDAIVRSAAQKIAQTATTGGMRMPLIDLERQLFLELAQELKRRGVSRKVSADMFGMTARNFQRRLRQYEARPEQNSLWQSILEFVQAQGRVTRHELERRFRFAESDLIASILRDMVRSKQIEERGRGTTAVFVAVDERTRMVPLATGVAA